MNSTMRAAKQTGLMLIIGTSAATSLPQILAELVFESLGRILVIDPKENYFTRRFKKYERFFWIKDKSTPAIVEIVKQFKFLSLRS